MKIRKKLRGLIASIILASMMVGNFNVKTVYAAPTCDMSDGVITIKITSHAATSNTRYRTIGFNVSTQYQSDTVTAKDHTGPAAPIGPCGKFYLSDGEKTPGPSNGEDTTTIFTFSDTKVKNALKDILDLDNISSDTKIYFNAIFQVYEIDDGKEEIKPGEKTTWEDIVNAESWGSVSDFKSYFNIETVFSPGPQPNTLYYDLDSTEYPQCDLNSLDIKEKVTWSSMVTNPAVINGKICNLTGFYVKNKLTQEITEDRRVGDVVIGASGPFTLTANYIINNASATVQYGGMDVHMVYEVDESKIMYPNSLYYVYGGTTKKVGDLASKTAGDTITWSSLAASKNPDTLFGSGKSYSLQGYYIKAKDSTVKLQGVTSLYKSTDDATDNQIIGGKATVVKGGIEVYMVYEAPSNITYPNSLYYVYEGSTKKVGELTSKTAGDTVTWSSLANGVSPGSLFGSGKTYNLQGYYIKAKDSTVSLQGVASLYKASDHVTDNQIIGGNAIVVKGGINVYIEYNTNPPVTQPPTPTPLPQITVTPIPTIPALDVPEGGSEVMPVMAPEATGIIKADSRGAEKFVVEHSIPTTESLYTQVQTTQYLIGYDFEKEVVVKDYNVTASKTFTLTWKNAKDPTKSMTETVTLTRPVTIRRACAYWKINRLDYYTLDNATVYNDALPGGKSVMYPDANYYSFPALSTSRSTDAQYHMTDPVAQNATVILDPETISSPDANRPVLSSDSFLYEANKKIGEIKVRNDYVSFNGSVIMNNNIYTKQTPALSNLAVLTPTRAKTGINVLYKPNQIIEATLDNGSYNSSGTITYKKHTAAVNSSPTYSALIINLNPVKVHTPVICDPNISANNKKWVQLIDPEEGYVPLVLDPDPSLSDFTVSISNTGKHNSYVGYFTRDFAWSLRSPNVVSYIAQYNNFYRNEVKFPFDVYQKKASGEDDYIPKETWIRIAFNSPSFYLPMWVEEGKYKVQFRTIAVNADTDYKININTEKYANKNPSNYVATNTINVQVSGRIYGLKITDISDERNWDEVFHDGGMSELKIDGSYETGVNKTNYNKFYAYDYTVGTNDQYGNITERLPKYTLPLVNGSNPRWTNIGLLRKGYSVFFRLTTTGSRYGSGDSILIRPKFYYVDAKGKNRQEVDIYYTQYFNHKSNDLVKIGGLTDKTNIFDFRVDELLPKNAWQTMADIFNIKYPSYKSKRLQLFTYAKMQIYSPMMAYSNLDYLQDVKATSQYSKIKNAGIKPADIMDRMQTWYGEYWLPADIHVVAKGTDIYGYAKNKGITYHESFWLTGGYIIINFDIVTVDSSGREQLSYTNLDNALNGYCGMWGMEGAAAYKTSYQGKVKGSFEFNFEPGDFLIYYTDISLRDDYTTYILQ